MNFTKVKFLVSRDLWVQDVQRLQEHFSEQTRNESGRYLYGKRTAREVTINSPQDAVKYGIGYLSEDRKRYGVVVQKTVAENTTLATLEEFHEWNLH